MSCSNHMALEIAREWAKIRQEGYILTAELPYSDNGHRVRARTDKQTVEIYLNSGIWFRIWTEPQTGGTEKQCRTTPKIKMNLFAFSSSSIGSWSSNTLMCYLIAELNKSKSSFLSLSGSLETVRSLNLFEERCNNLSSISWILTTRAATPAAHAVHQIALWPTQPVIKRERSNFDVSIIIHFKWHVFISAFSLPSAHGSWVFI